MAQLKAFQALRYNPEIVGDMSLVVTPPFDVISPEQQKAFYEAHPQNIIRLILGREFETDNEKINRHTRAADYFRKWRESNVLVRDAKPALYLYAIEYNLENGEQRKRTGFLSLVKIEDIDGGSIRRHERTFSETKSERFNLMKACRANFSPIFALYSDPEKYVSGLLGKAQPKRPVVDFVDRDLTRHLLSPVTDPQVIQSVQEWFQSSELFIADGHHRYETAAKFWEYVKNKEGAKEAGHPAQYVMMYLCDTTENVTILPAHRLLVSWPSPPDKDGFLKSIEHHFSVEPFEFDTSNKDEVRTRFFSALEEAGRNTHAYGFVWKGDSRYLLLRMKPETMNGRFGKGLPQVLKNLDSTSFNEVILRGILGMTDGDLDSHRKLHYNSRYNTALDLVEKGVYPAGFLMNPTRVDQVMEIAKAGLVMPTKSTYFYPKVTAGLVINTL